MPDIPQFTRPPLSRKIDTSPNVRRAKVKIPCFRRIFQNQPTESCSFKWGGAFCRTWGKHRWGTETSHRTGRWNDDLQAVLWPPVQILLCCSLKRGKAGQGGGVRTKCNDLKQKRERSLFAISHSALPSWGTRIWPSKGRGQRPTFSGAPWDCDACEHLGNAVLYQTRLDTELCPKNFSWYWKEVARNNVEGESEVRRGS